MVEVFKMKYYAYVEKEIAEKLGLVSVSTRSNNIGGKEYSTKMFLVDRDVYENAGYNHGKKLNINGKLVQDKYVFSF